MIDQQTEDLERFEFLLEYSQERLDMYRKFSHFQIFAMGNFHLTFHRLWGIEVEEHPVYEYGELVALTLKVEYEEEVYEFTTWVNEDA